MTIARLSFFVGRRSQNFLEEILCYRLNRKTLKTNTSFVLILRKLRANEVKFRRKTCTVESPYLSCTRISPNPKKKLIRFETNFNYKLPPLLPSPSPGIIRKRSIYPKLPGLSQHQSNCGSGFYRGKNSCVKSLSEKGAITKTNSKNNFL